MRDAGPDSGLTSQSLARAMRAGLELRRFAALEVMARTVKPTVADIPPAPALPVAALPGVRPSLEPYANALGHPATARPGLFGHLLRQTRRGFKALLRPWLEIQTRFNHATIASLENSNSAIQGHLDLLTTQLNAHGQLLAALGRSLEECRQTLEAQRSDLEARIEDCFDCLHASRQTLEARIDKYREGLGVEGNTPAILEQLFIQTRLPAPPVRILEFSRDQKGSEVDMSNLGYQVVRVDPGLNFLSRPSASDLPFEDEYFDAIVFPSGLTDIAEETECVGRPASEAARLLRRGGRLLITGLGVEAWDSLKQHLQPFRVIEQAFGVRKHGTWSFTSHEGVARRCAEMVAVLVLAEKP